MKKYGVVAPSAFQAYKREVLEEIQQLKNTVDRWQQVAADLAHAGSLAIDHVDSGVYRWDHVKRCIDNALNAYQEAHKATMEAPF